MSTGAADIPEFGEPIPGVTYRLRPGGYAILFDAAGRVAVVSTPSGLAVPGGGQEAGEDAAHAAIREVMEECGLEITVGERIGVADDWAYAPDYGEYFRKRCTYFLAEIVGQRGTGEADHELVWMAPAEAAATLMHGSQRWAVTEACGRIGRGL